ncbi:MAG: ABC transporter substrate-binding protein [Mycetocola sp.]
MTHTTTPPPASASATARRHRRRRTIGVALAAAVALLVSGCSIQITSRPDSSIPADTMLINADRGNPLFDRNFNPFLPNTRTAAKWMYEPLILTNPLDGARTPWLAEEWTLPDPRTIDLTIREGVEWSDGSAFTTDDVVFTFELIKEFPALDIKGAWQHIESIEVEGDHVIFHLLTDDVPSLSIIGATFMVSEKYWSDVEDPTSWRNPDPIGTGPFVLGNYNQQQYSMDKYDGYWQADSIEIEHLILPATNTQLDTVARGYDWAYSYISDVEGTWGAASEHNQYWFPPGGVIALIPNLETAPFDDVNVRRGISLALDRAKIADGATEGYMDAAGQTGLILPNQQDVLNPDIPNGGMIEQDTDAALAAFAESGYTLEGDTLVDSAGEPFEFAITTANGYTDWTRAVQEVQSQLGDIGIRVTLKQPQPAGYQAAINNGDFEVAMGGMGNGDVFQAFNSLLSSEFYVPSGEATSNNFERFQDPEVDELLTAYKSTTDEDEQKQLLYELQSVVYDQVPVIGMYYGGLWGLFSDAKFTGWPSAEDPYMAPQNYDSAPLLIFTRLKLVGENK